MFIITFFKKLFANNFGLFTYEKPRLEYANHPEYSLDSLKRISEELDFSWMKMFASDDDLYFDSNNLYVVNRDSNMAIFPLSEIVLLHRRNLKFGNLFLHQIIIKHSTDDFDIRFLAKRSFFGSGNFSEFHETIERINPDAMQKGWFIFW